MLTAVIVAAILLAGQPAPVTCDSTVSTRNALSAALSSTASSGKTVCVNADITGDRISVSTDFTTTARFVAQPADMTIEIVPLTINGAHKLTIDGFDVPAGGFDIANGEGSDDITITRNYFHDYVGNGIQALGGTTHARLTITGNRFSCVSYPPAGDPAGPTGYGLYGNSTVTDFTFSYNTIHGCGNSADGAEIGNIHGGVINNNVIDSIRWNGVGADPHTDCLMIWAQSSDVELANNRIFDCTGVLNSPDGTDITWTNNLLVDLDGGNACMDAHPNGSSGLVFPLRHTYERNTIVDCAATGILLDTGTGDRDGNVLDRNLLQGLYCPDLSTLETVDHNVFMSANPCSLPGTNSYNFLPHYADTIDYLPLNLPPGYSDVGYRRVPAGYTAFLGS